MVRYVSTTDLDLLAKAYAKIVEKIFLSIFTTEWLDDYLAFAEYAIRDNQETDLFRVMEAQAESSEEAEAIDPMLASKCFFMYAWNLFKNTCAENQIVIGLDQANDLLTGNVPGFKIIWCNLIDLIAELEDFRRMARNQIADFLDEQESAEVQARNQSLKIIGVLIDSRLQNTIKAYRPDITETCFAMEIQGLIEAIVARKIPCTVGDVQEALKLKIPTLGYHLEQSINRYDELLKKTPTREKRQETETPFDPTKITRHMATPKLEPIECVASVDYEKHCIYIQGEEFIIDYRGFNRAIHKMLEITPPIFYQKRLKEFLNFMEEYSKKTGSLPDFAKYVYLSYKAHKEKQMELMNRIKQYDIKWEIRFPILVGVLGIKHTNHIDQGIFAQT